MVICFIIKPLKVLSAFQIRYIAVCIIMSIIIIPCCFCVTCNFILLKSVENNVLQDMHEESKKTMKETMFCQISTKKVMKLNLLQRELHHSLHCYSSFANFKVIYLFSTMSYGNCLHLYFC